MATYFSLLRGINVGGEKKIAMKDLLSLYKDVGFKNVKTYVNSGNVIFNSELREISRLNALLERKIQETFGFDIPVVVMTVTEMEKVVQNNPFTKDRKIGVDKLYVTFLSEKPDERRILEMSIISAEADRYILREREAYLYIPGFYSKTKFSNAFFERHLKVMATTRNWKTVLALLDLAKNP
jgi:uncharacterized protein (DUF1697 family)